MSAAKGDPQAELASLYPALAPAVHAWACLRLGADDRPGLVPEDLTQEIWLRASELFARFDPNHASFRAWLFTVAKNVLLEARRRARRLRIEQPAQGSSTRLALLDQVPLEITSITRRVAADEDLRRLVEKVSRLDEIDRQTVLHCGFEALGPRDAAARLGESHAATAKRWQRLRIRLRDWSAPAGLVADD